MIFLRFSRTHTHTHIYAIYMQRARYTYFHALSERRMSIHSMHYIFLKQIYTHRI